jgi:hypothetical protein
VIAVLVWKHGTTKALAAEAIRNALREAGRGGSVTWSGDRATSRYGPFGSVVNAAGEVTDGEVVLEKCGGLAGGAVLRACREMLERLFPGGEQTA